MTFRYVILAAVFSTAATWASPGSGPAAEEVKRETPETKWQLAQGPRRGEAGEDEERKKRGEGRGQQREQKQEPRRSEPQSDGRSPAKAAPVQHEPRRGPRNEEEQSKRKEQPPRIEARPPAQPKTIVDDPRRRDKGQSNRNEPPPRIEARPPVQPKVINTEPSRGDDARKGLAPRGKGDDQREVRDDGRQKSRDARDERKDVREERRDPRDDRQDGRKEARDERRDHRAGPPFRRLDDLKGQRKQRVEQGGRTIIEEPDKRIIVKEKGRTIIRHDESERFRRKFKDAREERRNGLRIATFVRPDGVHVISEYDEHDRLVRRYRRHRDGRTVVLIDNRHHHHGPGFVTGLVVGALLNLPPPRVHIPREKYIVEYDDASYDDVYEALTAPPVEELDRGYTLDEIRYNHALRERMRRIDLDSITFDFGSWEVAPDQYGKLERIARAINRVLDRNPDEIFMIEGHTDAVGSDEDNLTLSDRRAETVAMILSDEFGVPPENLVTQGYGEQFLKIPTEAPERANRRVSVRRITPLMSRAAP